MVRALGRTPVTPFLVRDVVGLPQGGYLDSSARGSRRRLSAATVRCRDRDPTVEYPVLTTVPNRRLYMGFHF